MSELKTIKEVAEHFNVTTMAVRYWIKHKDIPCKVEKVIGIKPRIVLNVEDVERALGLSAKEG